MPFTRRTPRIPSRHLLTLRDLDDANGKVTCELHRHGFWSGAVPEIAVYLVPLSFVCYGWYRDAIYIPRVSGAQLVDLIAGHHTRLTDILRHEWAHGVADAFPDLIDSTTFREAFGGSYDDLRRLHEYDPSLHVTRYASSMPCEDFSEIFHHYLRHKGRVRLIWRQGLPSSGNGSSSRGWRNAPRGTATVSKLPLILTLPRTGRSGSPSRPFSFPPRTHPHTPPARHDPAA